MYYIGLVSYRAGDLVHTKRCLTVVYVQGVPNTPTITIRIPTELLRAIRARAKALGVPYQTLMRDALKEAFPEPQEEALALSGPSQDLGAGMGSEAVPGRPRRKGDPWSCPRCHRMVPAMNLCNHGSV